MGQALYLERPPFLCILQKGTPVLTGKRQDLRASEVSCSCMGESYMEVKDLERSAASPRSESAPVR